MEKGTNLNVSNIVYDSKAKVYTDTNIEALDELVNFYMCRTEIEHLGLLCRKASYRNEAVMQYIRDMRAKYNI